jgi:hypothetical protein
MELHDQAPSALEIVAVIVLDGLSCLSVSRAGSGQVRAIMSETVAVDPLPCDQARSRWRQGLL